LGLTKPLTEIEIVMVYGLAMTGEWIPVFTGMTEYNPPSKSADFWIGARTSKLSRSEFVAGSEGVKAFFAFGVDVRADDAADEGYMVAGGNLLNQSAFEIGCGIGKQNRINLFGRRGLAFEFCEFIYFSARM
jgi:hypothetical protein